MPVWTQESCLRRFSATLLFVLAAGAARAGSIAPDTSGPDPILNPAPGACAGATGGAEYVGGVDAYGNPVAPADDGAAAMPLASSTAIVTVPRKGGGHHGDAGDVSVAVDLNALAPPSCRPNAPPHNR